MAASVAFDEHIEATEPLPHHFCVGLPAALLYFFHAFPSFRVSRIRSRARIRVPAVRIDALADPRQLLLKYESNHIECHQAKVNAAFNHVLVIPLIAWSLSGNTIVCVLYLCSCMS